MKLQWKSNGKFRKKIDGKAPAMNDKHWTLGVGDYVVTL